MKAHFVKHLPQCGRLRVVAQVTSQISFSLHSLTGILTPPHYALQENGYSIRIGVDKSSSHHLSQFEIGDDNPVRDTYQNLNVR